MRLNTSSCFTHSKFILVLLFTITLAGCKDEIEEPTNSFEYSGLTYQIRDAIIQDIGPVDIINDDESKNTHHGYLVGFSDGDIQNDKEYIAEDARYVMVFYAYSPLITDTIGFNEGIYNYGSWLDFLDGDEDFLDETFFTVSSIIFDDDFDGLIYSDEETKEITGGIVNIQGTKPSYDMFFRLDLSLGKKINGNYSGLFEFVN